MSEEQTKNKRSSSLLLHGKYELGRLLGHGTFAKVYHAKNLENGKGMAMKIVGKENIIRVGMIEQVKREISVMKRVKHPNIVELEEVMASKSKIYLVMELVKGGELFNKVARGRIKEDKARVYFQQLIAAVDFCHSRGVYHRDLKPENLLLDEHGNLKVSDFGLSALSEHVKQDGLLHTTCGTPAYVAPEVITKRGYDGSKADIWSCGVILFVLLSGSLPFHDDNLVSMYRKIQKGDFVCPPWFSPHARDLVTNLLDPNPRTRISASMVMESCWFKGTEEKNMKNVEKKKKKTADFEGGSSESMNAFHIIGLLSEGFDLSKMVGGGVGGDEVRFGSTMEVGRLVERLEEVGREVRMEVRKKGERMVVMEGREKGRKGKMGIVAEIFPVASSQFSVVLVKKESGDTFEYLRFCTSCLRPALKDISWTT